MPGPARDHSLPSAGRPQRRGGRHGDTDGVVPLLGMAVGAAMGALSGSLADVGIDDDFIKEVRQKVTPGTSALFAMTSDAVADKVLAAMGDTQAELISTNLSGDQEAQLRAAFAEAEER